MQPLSPSPAPAVTARVCFPRDAGMSDTGSLNPCAPLFPTAPLRPLRAASTAASTSALEFALLPGAGAVFAADPNRVFVVATSAVTAWLVDTSSLAVSRDTSNDVPFTGVRAAALLRATNGETGLLCTCACVWVCICLPVCVHVCLCACLLVCACVWAPACT